MKVRTAVAVVLFLTVLPILADDTLQPKPPLYVQTILTKCEKAENDALRSYQQAMLTAYRAKLKALQDAMVTAAKQNNADAIPMIQQAITETKEKVKQDAAALPPTLSAVGLASDATSDFAWLEGTRWKRIDGAEMAFLPGERELAKENSGTPHPGSWKMLSDDQIDIFEDNKLHIVVTFSKKRQVAIWEYPNGGVGIWRAHN